MFLKYDC